MTLQSAVPILLILPGLLNAATVTLGSSANPSVFGQAVTLTATVAPVAATGSVTFYAGPTVMGSRPVSNGQATLTTSLLPFGTSSLQAYYSGDASNAAAKSAAVAQTVTTLPSNGFLPAVNYGVGAYPQAAAMCDCNGDGRPDLVVADGNFGAAGAVSVLLGNADGTFQAAVNVLDFGLGPSSVAVGDFNGDGKTDLAVVNVSSHNASVLLGNGDGTFQSSMILNVGANPRAVAVGDFNGDGKADLAVGNSFDNNVSVLLGKGDGTFQAAVNYGAGTAPQSVAPGDFNGDGKIDLAVANYGPPQGGGGSVSVLLGNGDGTFQSAVNYTAGFAPFEVTAGDLNGDGKADLAIANSGSNNLSVLLGNGDGTFKAAVNYTVAGSPRSVAVGDFNGDGKADLAVASYSGGVTVLSGNGDGTFQSAGNNAAGSAPLAVAVGDFNRDGAADLAVVNYLDGSVSVLLAKTATANPTISAVVNAASSQDGLASGTWIALYGSNLASTTRPWAQSDFVGNNLPTSLDGVTVTIDGKPAYMYYVSPTQVNVLAPNDAATGAVTVQLKNAAGASNAFSANKRAVAPAFFAYSQQSGKYAIAQDGSSFALLGPAGLLGAAAATRPAAVGEVITLYATGLGDTSPSYPDGQIIQMPAPLPVLPQVTIGGVTAQVQFAGIIGPGLYQLNVVVPAIPPGDAAVAAIVNGAASPAGIFLFIQ